MTILYYKTQLNFSLKPASSEQQKQLEKEKNAALWLVINTINPGSLKILDEQVQFIRSAII